MIRALLVGGSLCLLGAGCEPASGVEKVKNDSLVKPADVTLLRFDSLQHQRRFFCFDKVARAFVGRGFEYRPYQLGGNFVSAVWVKGVDFDGPFKLRGPNERQREMHRIEVQTLVVPAPYQARAAILRVQFVPADPDEWCVRLYSCEAGEQNVTGPCWSVTFFRWDPARLGIVGCDPDMYARERMELPPSRFDIGASRVELKSNRSVKDDFLRFVRSADTMRDAYLTDMAELEKQAIALLDAHKVMKMVYGEWRGKLPPREHPKPMTAEEEKVELARARQYFAARARFMRDHWREMYAALRNCFPLEGVWEELTEQGGKELPKGGTSSQ